MNRIIILIIIGVVVYIVGNKIYNSFSEKVLQKQDLREIERKIDSIYLEYQKIYDILALERDSIEVRVIENITNINIIREDVGNEKNLSSDEILSELKRLSLNAD